MQIAVRTLKVFDCQQGLAVQGRQELDAGVDRAVTDLAVRQFAKGDGTGAAIPLGTAFLGAGSPHVFTQVLQNRGRWIDVADLANGTVADKANCVPAGHDLALAATPTILAGFADTPEPD